MGAHARGGNRIVTAAAATVLAGLLAAPWAGLSAQGAAAEVGDPDLERQMELQRLRVLDYDELTPRQKEDWDDYVAIRPGRTPGNIAWTAFLRVPDLVDTMVRLRVHYGSDELQVSPRIYEWAAIVTARYWTANHPWNSHSPAAIREGVSPEAVKSLAEGRRPVAMADDEELAYDFLHELWENRYVTDATYDRAVEVFGEEGIIELVSIQALYGAIGAAHAVINAQEQTNELAPFTNRFNPPASMPLNR